MILSGLAVQKKGLGSSLVWSMKRLMAAWRSATERNTPRLSRRLESLAKKPSTAFSQEQEVGVKWKVHRRWRSSRSWALFLSTGCLGATSGMFVGGVVLQNGVDDLAGRNDALDGAEEADEFLVTVALHVAT